MRVGEVARNGFIGGAMSALGLMAMGAAMANPLSATIIVTGSVAYACLNSSQARNAVACAGRGAVRIAGGALTTGSPGETKMNQTVFAYSTIAVGGAAMVATGNPVCLAGATAVVLGSLGLAVIDVATR